MRCGLIATLSKWSKRFRVAEGGNVAITFGLVAIPLLLSVGGLIDFARSTMARSAMQDGLDATSLALARQPNIATMSLADMKTFTTNYFNANFTDSDAKNVTLTPTYDSSGPSVKVTGSATVSMNFLGLIGINSMTVGAASTTVWGQARLRVSLVLDNTGSMADAGKMTALKTATHNLLTQLKNAAAVDGDVYVSIIPFSKDANVGSSNYSQSWVRWDLWDDKNGTCSKSTYTTKTTCQQAGKTWTTAAHSTWNGCITDRDQNYDTLNTAPATATPATLFPAEQYGNCPGKLMGLSYDWTSLNSEVDAMYPNGNTNQAIGLQWGWQSLTQTPFTIPAFDPKYTYKQIIILLTDGLNTEDRFSTTQSTIDARQKIACANVKAGGIIMYTVQVNTGGDATSTMLKNCASDPSQFFLLTSADQIITTFNSIGTALSDLRISK
jgi:Flp pilus assembly protein TadG